MSGKIQLPLLPELPELLKNLPYKQDNWSAIFLKNVRAYNNALSMTSIGCNEIREAVFMPTFKIAGKLYRMLLLTGPEEKVKFLQI